MARSSTSSWRWFASAVSAASHSAGLDDECRELVVDDTPIALPSKQRDFSVVACSQHLGPRWTVVLELGLAVIRSPRVDTVYAHQVDSPDLIRNIARRLFLLAKQQQHLAFGFGSEERDGGTLPRRSSNWHPVVEVDIDVGVRAHNRPLEPGRDVDAEHLVPELLAGRIARGLLDGVVQEHEVPRIAIHRGRDDAGNTKNAGC